MSQLERILERARATRRRIVFPESGDARVRAAATRLAREGIVEPVLLGSGECAGVEVVDPARDPRRAEVVAAAEAALAPRGVSARDTEVLLADPLYYAAAMTRAGLAAGSVAGAAHSTADTLRAALRLIGPAPGVRLVSSFFLMELREPTEAGEPLLAFADCGLVPEPDAEQLAEIAERTAEQFALLAERTPRVALLSFSTKGSAEHESVTKVRRATEILKARAPGLAADGELQGDAALIPAIGRAKAGAGSPVAGMANVLIFPDLNSGNIAYKLVERLAGAQAIGPLLQGLRLPANDLSRGCREQDIVVAAAITSLQAGGRL